MKEICFHVRRAQSFQSTVFTEWPKEIQAAQVFLLLISTVLFTILMLVLPFLLMMMLLLLCWVLLVWLDLVYCIFFCQFVEEIQRIHFSFAGIVLFWLYISLLYLYHSSNFQSIYTVCLSSVVVVDIYFVSIYKWLWLCVRATFYSTLQIKKRKYTFTFTVKSWCQRIRQINTIYVKISFQFLYSTIEGKKIANIFNEITKKKRCFSANESCKQ